MCLISVDLVAAIFCTGTKYYLKHWKLCYCNVETLHLYVCCCEINCKPKICYFEEKHEIYARNLQGPGQNSVRSEGLPGGVLVPLFPSKIALCSHVPTLSQNVFVLYFFEILFPVPKNWLMFPCSLRYFANVPLFPQTPGRPSEALRVQHNWTSCQGYSISSTWLIPLVDQIAGY